MTRHQRVRRAGLLLLLSGTLSATGADDPLEALHTAHALFHAATNATQYAEAAQHYDDLVFQEGIRNGHLFYTLGNCWFMADDVGRAILNYRRAEPYLPYDDDLIHNLREAREQRTDLIETATPSRRSARLVRWHSNTSSRFRWRMFIGSWIVFWLAWARCRRTTRREPRIARGVAAILSVAMLTSLLIETVSRYHAQPGVILAPDVFARKGDGERYAPSYLDPLHAGTEFELLENRGAWWHVQLQDGRTCWIPAQAAELVSCPTGLTPAGHGP